MATAGGVDQKNQHSLRISDIVADPMKSLTPITGYMEMPIVALEKAVEPLISLVSDVVNHANIAKLRCIKPPPEGLTVDESAAIMLYTMNWKPREECLHVVLNAVMRNEDRSKLVPWHSYLKLLLTALGRLPSVQQTVYRGTRQEIQKNYAKGRSFVWWGFSSCTVSIDNLRAVVFAGPSSARTTFAIDCKTGKDIRKHSFYPTDDEILLLPATEFKVVSSVNHGDGLAMVQLQETASYSSLQQMALGSGKVKRQESVKKTNSASSINPNNILIWLDSNIDATDNSFRRMISKLQKVIVTMHIFTDPNKAVEQITQSSDKNIFLVISGAFGQNLVPIINDMPQIDSVFVFCGNKAFHEQWANKWSKTKGVFTEISDMGDVVKDAIEQSNK